MALLLCLLYLLNYIYEDSDSLIVINDSLVICGEHQYNIKIHLNNNARIITRQWNGIDSTGNIRLQAPLIYINSSSINGTGKGYSGGTNTHPDGYGPGCGYAGVGGGGGGGAYGGAGGDGGDLDPGAGGTPYGNATDTIIYMGSGGGAGRLSLVDGFGGNGGAMVSLKGQRIIIDSSNILSNGMRGYDGGYEAGGGGSGGGIKMYADTIRISYSSISAKGGAGGDAAGGGGGGGGGGRIKFFFAVVDTHFVSLSVSGGIGGIGGYGNGEDGFTGTIYFGPQVVVEETGKGYARHFSIFPRITNGILRFYSEKNNSKLFFYDVTGRLIKALRTMNGINYISLSELENGVYFLMVDDEHLLLKIVLIK